VKKLIFNYEFKGSPSAFVKTLEKSRGLWISLTAYLDLKFQMNSCLNGLCIVLLWLRSYFRFLRTKVMLTLCLDSQCILLQWW